MAKSVHERQEELDEKVVADVIVGSDEFLVWSSCVRSRIPTLASPCFSLEDGSPPCPLSSNSTRKQTPHGLLIKTC